MLKRLLKTSKTGKRAVILIKLAFISLCLFIALNCGKRKPPLPPVEKVAQRAAVSGIQRGNRVFLSWTMPAKNAEDKSTLNISRVDIYRLAEPQNAPLTLSEEEFASSSTLIASVPVSDADFGLKNLSYIDVLEFSDAAARLRYAVRFVNASGQKAALSNFLIVEPARKIAQSPSLQPAVVTEESVNLDWDAPNANVDGSSPANVLGYNIYRTTSDDAAAASAKILNNAPVTATKFSDSLFKFGENYAYFVRAVSIGGNGEPVESLDSNTVSVSPKDTFAPSEPTAITIAAAPGSISVFFAVNPEKDIAGYRVYRSSDAGLPKPEWQLLTAELLKTNTFQDKAVESGNTYYYFLTAVDSAGNVSRPSTVVSENVP